MHAVSASRRALLALALAALSAAVLCGAASAAPVGGKFQIRHVFVIILENESASVTFAPTSPAPYLRLCGQCANRRLPADRGPRHVA